MLGWNNVSTCYLHQWKACLTKKNPCWNPWLSTFWIQRRLVVFLWHNHDLKQVSQEPILQQMECPLTKPEPRLNMKTIFPRYGDSHVKDKTVVRPSYLKHGDPYTGKTFLYIEMTPRIHEELFRIKPKIWAGDLSLDESKHSAHFTDITALIKITAGISDILYHTIL